MSQQLISRSPDLKRLQDEGYTVQVLGGYLLLRDIPYVDADRSTKKGTLISKLALANDRASAPEDHVACFSGNHPCDTQGARLDKISNPSPAFVIDSSISANFTFSAKPQPTGRYVDYYDKMTTYAAIISGPALSIDPKLTPRPFRLIKSDDAGGPFSYIDTASSRAEINAASAKLQGGRVGIVGLGGTGSYILDLVAKTPVSEIRLFDGDIFLQHNAFRSPGAPTGPDLEKEESKANYFAAIYGRMHRGVVAHSVFLDDTNLNLLAGLDFVFLSLDRGEAKRLIVKWLEGQEIPFVDSGMGLYMEGDALGGIVRTTTSLPGRRSHVWDQGRIPFADGEHGNEYSANIQIADLNCLNAALAVIKWKKIRGFYHDFDEELHSAYAIDGNAIVNEDRG